MASASADQQRAQCPLLDAAGAVQGVFSVDWSRSDAFLSLPLEERERRTEAFRAALAPAFADYSSDDFRADQRAEAERE